MLVANPKSIGFAGSENVGAGVRSKSANPVDDFQPCLLVEASRHGRRLPKLVAALSLRQCRVPVAL